MRGNQSWPLAYLAPLLLVRQGGTSKVRSTPRPRWVSLAGVLASISACSLTNLDDLKGVPSDASIDQCSGLCGGTGGSAGSSGGAGGSDAASGGFAGADAGDAGGASGSGGDASSPCASDPNCSQCCVMMSGDGATEYVKTLTDCICLITSVCQGVCSTYCQNGGSPDAACSQCLGANEVQTCISQNCISSCKDYIDCVAGC